VVEAADLIHAYGRPQHTFACWRAAASDASRRL
jgi:hypothetical protein